MANSPQMPRLSRSALIEAVDAQLGILRDTNGHEEILPPNDFNDNTEAQKTMLEVLVDIYQSRLKGNSERAQRIRARQALVDEYDNEDLADRFTELVEGIIQDINPRQTAPDWVRKPTDAAKSRVSLLPDQQVDGKKVEGIIAAVVRAYAVHTHAEPDLNHKAHIGRWVHLRLHDRLKLHTLKEIEGRARIIDLTHQIVTTPGFRFTDLEGYRDLQAHLKEHGDDPVRPDRRPGEKAAGGGRRAG